MGRRKINSQPVIYRTVKVPMPVLSDGDFQKLIRARLDSGIIWASLVDYHRMIRRDRRRWPSMQDLAREMTGQTAECDLTLGTQSQNFIFEEFLGVVRTALENRKSGAAAGGKDAVRFPYRQRKARDCHWDRRDAKNVKGGFILSLAKMAESKNRSGLRRREPLFIPYKPGVPKNTTAITLHYSVDDRCFYLLFKIKEAEKPAVPVPTKVMGIDLGQIRLAACVTEVGESLNIKGRGLRSIQQGHQKRKAFRRARIDRMKMGSHHRRKEVRKLGRESRKARHQVTNVLHTVSRRVINFASKHGVSHIFIGDPNGVRDQDVGRRQNQANHDWATGRFKTLVSYKADWVHIATASINERGTTRSCPSPSCDGFHKPLGRVYQCKKCFLIAHRDGVGAWNICARGYVSIHGEQPRFEVGFVAFGGQKYLTPTGVKGARRSPRPRNPDQVVSSAEQPRLAGAIRSKHVTRGRAPVDGMEQVRKDGSRVQAADDQPAA